MNTARHIFAAASAVLITAAGALAGPIGSSFAPIELPVKIEAISKLGSKPRAAKPVEQTSRLIVTVVDQYGEPVEGVLVEIDPEHGAPAYSSAITSTKGRAEFKGLRADNWRVCVHSETEVEWTMVKVGGSIVHLTMKISVE